MQSKNQKITVEFNNSKKNTTNPISMKMNSCNLSDMIKNILDKELPMLKNNSLFHDLVLYTLLEKMNTVQNIENVLSYIKSRRVKNVNDVSFRNGEVLIKCSI